MARTRKEETYDQMIARYRKDLGKDIRETYTGHCVLGDHGEFTSTFQGFLNNPIGCNACIQKGMITWDRDFNEALVWEAIKKVIADKNKPKVEEAESDTV
jgi:hypothetical protein